MIDNMTLKDMLGYRGRQEVPTDFDAFGKRKDRLEVLPAYALAEKNVVFIMSVVMN